MSVQVNLPPGCSSLRMQDGTVYSAARRGGHVTVSDDHAPFIRRRTGGDAGLTGHASFREFTRTSRGRACPDCGRRWHVWTKVCPKCLVETEPE